MSASLLPAVECARRVVWLHGWAATALMPAVEGGAPPSPHNWVVVLLPLAKGSAWHANRPQSWAAEALVLATEDGARLILGAGWRRPSCQLWKELATLFGFTT